MTNSHEKALCIVGPTASGKTDFALSLSSQIPLEIISADSRQVYCGMDIGTGKDIPKGFVKKMSALQLRDDNLVYFENNVTRFWLIDQVTPTQEWSVSHFEEACQIIMKDCANRRVLPVLVGGTGMYLQSFLNPPESLHIPQNQHLRDSLESKTVEELQTILKEKNAARFEQMNHSDQMNPRRLVRAIEIAEDIKNSISSKKNTTLDVLTIGLLPSITYMSNAIRQRVLARIQQGIEKEVQSLLHMYGDAVTSTPAWSATGYQETATFLRGEISHDAWIDLWTLHEIQYAKRQLTWFKKQKEIEWFPFDSADQFPKTALEERVKTWYDKAI